MNLAKNKLRCHSCVHSEVDGGSLRCHHWLHPGFVAGIDTRQRPENWRWGYVSGCQWCAQCCHYEAGPLPGGSSGGATGKVKPKEKPVKLELSRDEREWLLDVLEAEIESETAKHERSRSDLSVLADARAVAALTRKRRARILHDRLNHQGEG